MSFVDAHRRTASAGTVASWLTELASVPMASALAYVPGAGSLRARTREQLICAITERNGARYSAWVHGTWLEFLGDRDPEDVLAPLFAYARSCSERGRPLDTTTLDAVYPPELVRSLRATVARAQLENLAGNSLDSLAGAALGQRPFSLVDSVKEAALMAGAVPFVAPMVAAAGAMWLADRLAPSLPEVRTPATPQSNLVVGMVAEAVPTYLGNTVLRTGLVWAPLNLSVAFRMEGGAATLTIGRGEISVDEGVRPEALVIVDGGLDSLLHVVAGSIAGQLTSAGPLRRR
jgi:hypothetical protein